MLSSMQSKYLLSYRIISTTTLKALNLAFYPPQNILITHNSLPLPPTPLIILLPGPVPDTAISDQRSTKIPEGCVPQAPCQGLSRQSGPFGQRSVILVRENQSERSSPPPHTPRTKTSGRCPPHSPAGNPPPRRRPDYPRPRTPLRCTSQAILVPLAAGTSEQGSHNL